MNAHLDSRKFITLKQGLETFEEKNGRPMIVEEFVDYARTHFSDRTFVDSLCKYCAEKWPEHNETTEADALVQNKEEKP